MTAGSMERRVADLAFSLRQVPLATEAARRYIAEFGDRAAASQGKLPVWG